MKELGSTVPRVLLSVINLLNKVYGSLLYSLNFSIFIVLIAICSVKILIYYYKNLVKMEKRQQMLQEQISKSYSEVKFKQMFESLK